MIMHAGLFPSNSLEGFQSFLGQFARGRALERSIVPSQAEGTV